jgi:hypothetical protein
LIFASFKLFFFFSFSLLSSALAFQFAIGLNTIFSPTLVVSLCGPTALPFSDPNLSHSLRSATRGLTTRLMTVFLMRRVVLIFLPSSRIEYVMVVSVPSLFLMVCGAGSWGESSYSSAQLVLSGV